MRQKADVIVHKDRAPLVGESDTDLVVYVDPAGPGFAAGLQPGDVIQTIDGKPLTVNGMSNFANLTPDSTSTFEIIRKKKRLEIEVKVREEKQD